MSAAPRRVATASLLLFFAFGPQAWAVDLEREVTVEIPAQPLASAVIEFGRQTGIQIVTAGADIAGLSSAGVLGTHRLGEALRLLLIGTGMDFKSVGDVTVALVTTVGVIPLPSEQLPAEDVTELDAIVVTAGKRAQNIAEFAGSITAISGDQLEKIGAQSFEDYLKLVPGVTMNRNGPDQSAPIIRGIATDTVPGIGLIGSRTTGIFVDEIPMNDLFITTANIDMNPFDLERVEILKGPQGTLFGSSSIAGAIRYITHKPELHVWQTKVLGSFTAIEQGGQKPLGAAMANIPIGQTAAVRAVGLYRESPGYIDDLNRGLKDVGELRQSASRVLGSWLPTDRLTLTATYLEQRTDIADVDFADQRERLERATTNAPNNGKSRFSVANLVGSYDFGWGSVLSSTSRVTKDNFFLSNSDRGLPGEPRTGTEGVGAEDQSQPVFTGLSIGDLDGVTQEVRISSPEDSGRWQWLAGLAFLRFDSFTVAIGRTPLDPTLDMSPQDPFAPPIFPVDTPAGSVVGREDAEFQFATFDGRATEKALFAEATRSLWDRWEITLGGRLFQTHLVADTVFRGLFLPLSSPGQTVSEERSEVEESGFNPKLAARFLMNRNVNLYALAAKGFQFGGVQLTPLDPAREAILEGQPGPKFEPYKSSELWNFEIGAKTEWWNSRLQFDATLFHLRWKDLQLLQIVTFQGSGVASAFTNVGLATSSGAELAFRVTPMRGLSWQSAASWVDAVTAVTVEGSEFSQPPGWQLPGSARFQMANALSYEQPFAFLGNWSAGIGLTHTHSGPIFNDLQHSAQYGNYDTCDASVHLLNSNLSWQPDVRLNVINLFDTRGVSGVGTCLGCRFEDVSFIRPRTWIVSLEIRF